MQPQIQKLESEIQEKMKQMKVLEKHITESGEASIADASIIDMQQTVMRLMTQCNEKGFELEIKSADNRVLQEHLVDKCLEIKQLQDQVLLLQQQLALATGDKSPSSEQDSGKLYLEHVQLKEENSGLRIQNQKLAEEASYAKELASAAAVELKNLADEVTKLSLQNSRQAKELGAAQDMVACYKGGIQSNNGSSRKYSESKVDGMKVGRKNRFPVRGSELPGTAYDDGEYWNPDQDDVKMELEASKHREAALEAALAEREFAEEEYRKQFDEARKREVALENDLANMWVLVAKLKKEGGAGSESKYDGKSSDGSEHVYNIKTSDNDDKDVGVKELQVQESAKPVNIVSKVEQPLVVRLKAKMQEMKEKQLEESIGNALNQQLQLFSFPADTSAYASSVRLLVPSAHFVAQKLRIESSRSLPNSAHMIKRLYKGTLHHLALRCGRMQFFN
ncbi:hypothetical protein MKX01_033180 [Papaver californicum]|nr:hypothetical protein MKX01_033180 [Papaver californicum]